MADENNLSILDKLVKVSQAKMLKDGLNSTDDIAGLTARLEDLEDRVLALEIASGAEVTANPFAVTFGTLDGISADGIWNTAESRMEF